MDGIKKLGVLTVVGALVILLATLRPGEDTPKAEGDLGMPGGMAALPSAAPAIPGMANQSIPAVIGTGQPGIVSVFCSGRSLPLAAGACFDADAPAGGQTSGSITLEIEKLYPPGGGEPGLTFDANGERTMVVTDNTTADMDAAMGVVTVRVNAAAATQGGTQGVNEVVNIIATDEVGDQRSVMMVVVDTIMAFGATGPVSSASQQQPLFVVYHCGVTGRAPLIPGSGAWLADPDQDGWQGLDDMYDGYYSAYYVDGIGPGLGYGTNSSGPQNPVSDLPDLDLQDVWCGGNTDPLYDDSINVETDMGLFSMEPVAQGLQAGADLARGNGLFFPPIVGADCGEGKSLDYRDVDALSHWYHWITHKCGGVFCWPGLFPAGDPRNTGGPYEGGCDADGWRNGVVAAVLLGTGEVGVATVTAQQGGGVSPPRTVNVTFVGEAAVSLFLDAPSTIGPEGAEFSAFVVDQDFRPVGDETIQCTVDPTGAALILIPQTGTTGNFLSATPGEAVFRLIPTGASVVAGESLTITCRLDRDRSVVAVQPVQLMLTESESVDLVTGCNPVASTWPDATPVETVGEAVSPAEALDAIWALEPASAVWQGYSPAAPEASDLASVDELEALFICVNAAAAIERPVI